MAIIFNNRLLWEGGVVYHLRRPSSTGCQIVKRGFSENKDETVKQDMLLLTKYKLHTFDSFLFFFLVCLCWFFVVVETCVVSSPAVGFGADLKKQGSSHKLTSQRKSSFDWFSGKAGAGDIVLTYSTLFKSEQLPCFVSDENQI